MSIRSTLRSAARQRAARRPASVALGVIAASLVVTTAIAQLVVFDPSTYGEAVQQFIQLEHQYAELVQTYELLLQETQRMPGNLDARYRSLATPWIALAAPDTYGTTSGWVSAANTGWDTLAGYRGLTEPLRTYGAGFDSLSADELERIKAKYGTVELADGINLHALEMMGHLRGHAGDVEFALRRLEDDSFSSDPDANTQVAVLNKINAATVTAARLTKDTNQLLVSVLEQQLAGAKRQRDREAVAINAHIAFEAQARDLLRQTTAGTTDTLMNFRVP
jgi:hypothetical protein